MYQVAGNNRKEEASLAACRAPHVACGQFTQADFSPKDSSGLARTDVSPRNSHAGFTLIEALVAIAILLLAVVAPLSLAERSLASAEAAKQEMVALYLGQEAMEFVRNARDQNFLSGKGGTNSWLQGLSECAKAAGCGVDPTAPAGKQIVACDAKNDNCALWQNTGAPPDEELAGLYGLAPSRSNGTSGWIKTVFQRKVCIVAVTEPSVCADESGNALDTASDARVSVIVSWRGSFGPRSLTANTVFSNWYSGK